ncbi:MAG: hypothetical protein GY909_14510 [Oligoflexia bacterium]|nr:hypothetical protein [Oligoflexia bacterium]
MFKRLVAILFLLTTSHTQAEQFEVYDLDAVNNRYATFTMVANPGSLTLDCESFLNGVTVDGTNQFFYLSEAECVDLFQTLKTYLNSNETLCLSMDFDTKEWGYWKGYEGCL